MTYYVTYKIEARFIASVKADSIAEALEVANERFTDADFGVAEDIDGEPLIVENEDGNYVWER